MDPATTLVYRYLDRAAALHAEGYATREDIDTAMRLGCGLPSGPMTHRDEIGAETVTAALRGAGVAVTPSPRAARPVLDPEQPGGDGPRPGTVTGRPVERAGVVGSGTMARGIAQVLVAAGIHTTVVARDAARAGAVAHAVEGGLSRLAAKGRLDAAEVPGMLERLDAGVDYPALADCDLVIEAVAEHPAAKDDVFARLGRVCRPGAVLATTTSSLAVGACARASGRPGDVVGMHFFNPAPAMRLVEVARTAWTRPEVAATAHQLVARLGKVGVDCPDRAGFIVNYLLFPYLRDAVVMVERDVAGVLALDDAVRDRFGYPMGPFALLDTIGLDVSAAILRRLHDVFAVPHFEPPRRLLDLVGAGDLGRKSGRGFLEWPARSGVAVAAAGARAA